MRIWTVISLIATSCFLFGCNSSEDDSHLTPNSNSLQGQQNTTTSNPAEQTAGKQDNSSGQQAADKQGSGRQGAADKPDKQDNQEPSGPTEKADDNANHQTDDTGKSDKTDKTDKESPDVPEDKLPDDNKLDKPSDNHPSDNNPSHNIDGKPADNVSLLFASDLAVYYMALEKEKNDHTVSDKSWTKTIQSAAEANVFVQTYKLNDTVKDKLTAIDYKDNIVDAIYIGHRPVYSYKFNAVCDDKAIELEVISCASGMDDAESYLLVFMQVPAQFKDNEIIIKDKEVSLEEYDSYSLLTEL